MVWFASMAGAESPASVVCDKGSNSRSGAASLATVKLALLQAVNTVRTNEFTNHRFCISSLAGGSIDEAETRFFTKVSLLSYM